ncbi:aldo/keto reductase [Amnibacterium flavum]|uniref:Aldo/keto reductase n=1 Tax=Amnibacterium flavum TaxID=2173173 RepID=A0A2V1HXY1_9MICO|nr:aldo/keto reductase [Amnibacterium flavum]PVZ96230.1 aldo/keto reductase [Amnibacterium flavum]
MEYRNLGRSGLRVSAVGLGCNNLSRPGTATESQEGTTAVVDAALDSGVNFFDTAEMYGVAFGASESRLGAALAGRRDAAVIATKFGHTDIPSQIEGWGAKASRRYIRLAVEGSLRRLQTDWIDLYQLHTPNPLVPIEETLAALGELIDEGKIRYIGHSNFAAWQLVEAEYIARELGSERFISAQNEYSLLVRGAERELFPAADRFGVGFLPFYPLYNGVFTGKYSRQGGPEDSRIMQRRPQLLETVPWDAVDAFAAFAADRGITMLEATVGWLLSHSGVSSVIAGATTPEQISQNAAAGTAWIPSPDEVEQIEELFPLA